jgi:hypothetical protein
VSFGGKDASRLENVLPCGLAGRRSQGRGFEPQKRAHLNKSAVLTVEDSLKLHFDELSRVATGSFNPVSATIRYALENQVVSYYGIMGTRGHHGML